MIDNTDVDGFQRCVETGEVFHHFLLNGVHVGGPQGMICPEPAPAYPISAVSASTATCPTTRPSPKTDTGASATAICCASYSR